MRRLFRLPRVGASYDAAQTTTDNTRHWANADALSARAAHDPGTRKTIRERARYECQENNSYAKGIVLTLANDLIGTGPRLQLLTEDNELNSEIERLFKQWARACGLAAKLRTMKLAKTVDGEAFAIMRTNPLLPSSVKLDLQLVEADQICTPGFWPQVFFDPMKWDDGIEFDAAGNPTYYHLLKNHPGDSYASALDYTRIEAEYVLHWFRQDRPGQCRGVSELAPCLSLFADLRRYTSAVVAAAETAADFAVLLKTQVAPSETEPAEPFESLDIEKRMMTVLPAGYEGYQMTAEQPSTTYVDFVRTLVREVSRCLNVPLTVALGDASQSNYSSARVEFQAYYKALEVERSTCDAVILSRLFAAWLQEAVRIPDYLPRAAAVADLSDHDWFWDGFRHVDPLKEASATGMNLLNNTTTHQEECAREGRDWEKVFRQRARELKLAKDLEIPLVAPPVTTQPDTSYYGDSSRELQQDA